MLFFEFLSINALKASNEYDFSRKCFSCDRISLKIRYIHSIFILNFLAKNIIYIFNFNLKFKYF